MLFQTHRIALKPLSLSRQKKKRRVLEVQTLSEQIAEIVARWTSIPVTRMILMSTVKEKLLRMEKILSERVVGQPEAVKAVDCRNAA